MAFISTKFDIGDTVYWHDAVSDSVARGKVASITARHDDDGGPRVSYGVIASARASATVTSSEWLQLPEARLFSNPRDAFPELVAVAEPTPA